MGKTVKELAPTLSEALGEQGTLTHIEDEKKKASAGPAQRPPIQPKRYRQLVALLIARPSVTNDEIIGYWKDSKGQKVVGNPDPKAGHTFVDGLVSNMFPDVIATVKAELAELAANPTAEVSKPPAEGKEG